MTSGRLARLPVAVEILSRLTWPFTVQRVNPRRPARSGPWATRSARRGRLARGPVCSMTLSTSTAGPGRDRPRRVGLGWLRCRPQRVRTGMPVPLVACPRDRPRRGGHDCQRSAQAWLPSDRWTSRRPSTLGGGLRPTVAGPQVASTASGEIMRLTDFGTPTRPSAARVGRAALGTRRGRGLSVAVAAAAMAALPAGCGGRSASSTGQDEPAAAASASAGATAAGPAGTTAARPQPPGSSAPEPSAPASSAHPVVSTPSRRTLRPVPIPPACELNPPADGSQSAADAGQLPWRLDPVQVVGQCLRRDLGRAAWTIARLNASTVAVTEPRTHLTARFHLDQPARQGPGGIRGVASIDATAALRPPPDLRGSRSRRPADELRRGPPALAGQSGDGRRILRRRRVRLLTPPPTTAVRRPHPGPRRVDRRARRGLRPPVNRR